MASAASQAGFAAPPPPPLLVDWAAVTVTGTVVLLVSPLVGSVTVSFTSPVPAAAPVTTTLAPVVAPSVTKESASGIDHWYVRAVPLEPRTLPVPLSVTALPTTTLAVVGDTRAVGAV